MKKNQIRTPQFDDETAEVIQEVVAWWKQRQRQAASGPSYKPRFVGKTEPRTVRIPRQLEAAALKKAKTEAYVGRTGATLNGLVNWLLWQFCDFDPRLLKHASGEADSEHAD